MADPQAATDAPANAAPNIVGMVGNITDDDKKRDAILKQEATITSRQVGTEGVLAAQEEKRSNEYRSRMEQMLNAEGAGVNDLKPWNAQQELAQRKTGLWDQFGSPGFVIGMIASAFSGAPMVSALNAGAAAMNAINQGDMEGYNKAFEAWKDNTDLTLKRLDMEHKAFDEIDKLRSSDMEDWRARATLLLQRFNDQRKLVLLHNGMDDEYFKLRDAEATSASNMAIAQRGIMEQNVLLRAVNSDPRWKSGDPKQMMAAYTDAIKQLEQAKYSGRYGMFTTGRENAQTVADVKAQLHKQHPEWDDAKVDTETNKIIAASKASPITGNKRADLERHIGLYNDAVKIIDQVTDTLNKYIGAAGIPGRATRLGERLRDIAGSHDTDRVQMMRDIEQLQLMAPTLLLDRTGRPLSAEHEYVESIIAGLNAGDTNANTLRAMREIRDRLLAIRNRDNTAIGEGEPGTAPQAPAKETDQPWLNDPLH